MRLVTTHRRARRGRRRRPGGPPAAVDSESSIDVVLRDERAGAARHRRPIAGRGRPHRHRGLRRSARRRRRGAGRSARHPPRTGAAPRGGRHPRRVGLRRDRRRPGPARPRRRGPRAGRHGGGGRRLRPGPVVRAGAPTPPPGSTRSTRSTWPRSAPAARPAPASTTGPFGGRALDWRDGGWAQRPGGSGRELCWFPDPVGGRGLLPGRAARRAAAGAGLPRRRAGSPPAWRPPAATGSPPGSRCCGRRTPRAARARSASRSAADGAPAATCAVLGVMDRPAVAAGAVAARHGHVWPTQGRADPRRRRRPGRAGRSGAVPVRAAPPRGACRGLPAATPDPLPV